MYAPSLEIELDPVGPLYRIHQEDRMPQITARAKILNPPDELAGWDKRPYPPGLTYEWDISLVMHPAKIPHAHGRTTTHPQIRARTFGPEFAIPFTKIRGGDLGISLTVAGTGLKVPLRSKTRGLKVLGNTAAFTEQTLYAAGASELMVKIIRHESTMRQFRDSGPWAGYPLFSQDNLGGVGLTQLTNPHPNDDEVWSWRANLAKGMRVLREKRDLAKAYLTSYQSSAQFQSYVGKYNETRIRNALKEGIPIPASLKIGLPQPTEDQLERETVRGYNGWAGGIHEYTAKVSGSDSVLVVRESPGSNIAIASWHEITGEEREQLWIARKQLDQNGHQHTSSSPWCK